MRRLLAPLTSRDTYLRWACLILGGALLMPYMMAGAVVAGILRAVPQDGSLLALMQPLVFVCVLPLVALTGLVLPVRALEITAARGLLGAEIGPLPATARRTWAERRRTAAWFTLHLGLGGMLAAITLAVIPFVIWLVALPFFDGVDAPAAALLPAWWSDVWALPAAVASAFALVQLVAGVGRLLAWSAPRLLGPSAGDRLAAAEERARDLAARNRLARELHDSVGHALSVVTVQAGAANRILDRDPPAVRQALAAIERQARGALEELDHVLGVLREENGAGGPEAPRATGRSLADLAELTGPAGADATVRGELDALSPPISREGYRIVQESLTNAIRHGDGPASLSVIVDADHLEISVRNPVTRRESPARSGGRGLAGMRERVTLLGGELRAGAEEEHWLVHVRLPLHA
ncbi:histidine kinase [Streptosporangium soli]|nr:histidine kinase [Streptosporangium sp. KLBMP 9127]